MKRFRLMLCLLVLAMVFTSPAHAQEVVELEKTVVTATRTPEVLRNVSSSVSIITRDEIENSTARTVDDLLIKKAGINIRKAGVSHTDNKITLRGLGKVLILIDGLQANDAIAGQQLDNLPLESVERIEIVRGAASAVYGSEAMGGVVNIITKKPEKKLQGYIDGGGGNLDTYRAGGQLSGSYKDLGLLFTTKREETGGYIPTRHKYRKHGVSYKDQDVHTLEQFGKLNYEITADSDINLQYLRTYNHVDNSTGKKNQMNDRDRDRVQGSYNLRIGEIDSSLKGFYQKDNFTYNSLEYMTNIPKYKMDSDRDLWGVSLQASRDITDFWRLTAGVDYKNAELDTGYDYYFETRDKLCEGKQDYWGPFLQNRFSFLDKRLILHLGLRYDTWRSHDAKNFDSKYQADPTDYGSNTDGAVNPKFGLTYDLPWDSTIRASVGRAFRAPTIMDLYYTWYYGTTTYAGNPDLDPEDMRSYDIGLEKRFGSKGKVSITYYYNKIEDQITSIVVQESPKIKQKQNVGEAESQGIELAANYDICYWLSIFANYTYNHSKIKEFSVDPSLEGNRLAWSPYNKANYGLTYRGPYSITATLNGNYKGNCWHENKNTKRMEAYTVLDLALRWKPSKHIELWSDIHNLNNKKYSGMTDTYRMPGLIWLAGAKFNF